MKHLYSLTLIASLATIGVVMANPKLFDNLSTGIKERWRSWKSPAANHPEAPTWDGASLPDEAIPAALSTFGGQTGSSTPPANITGFRGASIASPAPSHSAQSHSAPPHSAPSLPQFSGPVVPPSPPSPSFQTNDFPANSFAPPTTDTTYHHATTYEPMAAAAPMAPVVPVAEPTSFAPTPTPAFDPPVVATPATPDLWGANSDSLPSLPSTSESWGTTPYALATTPASLATPLAIHTPSQQPLAPPDASALAPTIFSEVVSIQGADTIARIGTHVVLLCDVLPQAKRGALEIWDEKVKTLPESQQAEITPDQREAFLRQAMMAQYPSLLQEQVQIALLYNDFAASRKREEVEAQEKRVDGVFDQEEVSKLVEALRVENVAALKQKLKNDYGTSLERERLLFIRKMIAFGWLSAAVGDVESQCTHDEMIEYYNLHKSEFEQKGRARWQELFVRKGDSMSDRDAWNKLAWMGNAVAAGTPMEQVARDHSQGMKASSGGVWDWITRGSLASQQLDDYIFTAPVGELSPIIETPQGLYIVRVVERFETSHTPFLEAQVAIREKIRSERRADRNVEYFTQLQRRYPIEIIKNSLNLSPSAMATTGPAMR